MVLYWGIFNKSFFIYIYRLSVLVQVFWAVNAPSEEAENPGQHRWNQEKVWKMYNLWFLNKCYLVEKQKIHPQLLLDLKKKKHWQMLIEDQKWIISLNLTKSFFSFLKVWRKIDVCTKQFYFIKAPKPWKNVIVRNKDRIVNVKIILI